MNASAFSAFPSRPLRLAGALMVLVFLCSCRLNLTGEEGKERIGKILAARKPESLKEWKDRKIDGETAEHYLQRRLAVLSNATNVLIVRSGEHTHMIRLKSKEPLYVGSAVPVTTDGYFLTAAHNDLPEIFAHNTRGELVRRKARVVWTGWEKEGEPDVAILHVPMKLPCAAPIRESAPLRAGTSVLAYGTGMFTPGQGGGRVISVSDWKTSPGGVRWREVFHDAPTVPGDSGGPLIDEQGKLIGVHSLLSAGLLVNVWLWNRDYVFGYRGEAVSPDPAWVEKIIKEDRERRKKRSQRRP